MKLYHLICRWFKRNRAELPLEKRLGADVLARVMQEAGVLKRAHNVEVREVAEGEAATMPKAVDANVEAALPKLEIKV